MEGEGALEGEGGRGRAGPTSDPSKLSSRKRILMGFDLIASKYF